MMDKLLAIVFTILMTAFVFLGTAAIAVNLTDSPGLQLLLHFKMSVGSSLVCYHIFKKVMK